MPERADNLSDTPRRRGPARHRHSESRRTVGVATLALGSALAVVLGALVPAGGAFADSQPLDPSAPLSPKTVTADSLPTPQIDGVVWDQVVVGNTVFVGGQFTTARPDGAAEGVNTVPRSNFLAYDLTTGALRTDIAPAFNARVLSMDASPDGTRLYVSGAFTTVGSATRYRVAAFSLPSMTLVSSWAPTVNSTVEAVAATNSTVYITGPFTSSQKTARSGAAALSAQTAAIQPWAPVLSGGTGRAMVISPDESKIVVGGSFTTLNGSNNPGIGMGAVTADTGASLPWKVNATIRNGGTKSSIYDLSSDADSVYGVGYQHSQGGQAIEGTFRASWSDGTLEWLADCHGDTYSVEVSGGVVYTAGHAHACDNTGGFPNNPDAYHRAVAFTTQPSGTTVFNQPPAGWTYGNFAGTPATHLLNWFPTFNTGTYTGSTQGPWSVTTAGDYALYGGEFTKVNGRGQQGLARFATSDKAPNKRGPNLQGDAMAPTVTAFGGGAAKVTFAANADDDNENLTYTVIRNGDTAHPVYTNTVASTFWNRPAITFVDSGLTPGATYTYRVRTEDPFGNATSGTTVSFTATAGDAARVTGYDKTVLADLPSHYWPLNEASGATAADWTGGATQTFTGTGLVRGAAGAETDGSGAAVRLGGNARSTSTTIAKMPNTFSAEAWFSTTSTRGGLLIGASNQNGGNRDRALYMGNDGRLHFGVYPGSVRMVDSDAGYNDGAWHHVVVTLGPVGMQMYVDGSLVDSRTDTTSAQDYSGYWALGGYSLAGWPDRPTNDAFTGSIDNVATYSTQLTAARVAAHTAAAGGAVEPEPEPANVAPVASFTSAVTNLSVAFNATGSHDPDGTIAGYAWSFGDGKTGTGATPTHAYAAAGTYTVGLTVTDDDGATHSTSSSVTAVAPTVPAPQVIAADDFARTSASTWGSAKTGGAWVTSGSTGGYSVGNGAGTVSVAKGQTKTAMLSSVAAGSSVTRVSFVIDQAPTGGGQFVRMIARQVGSDRYNAQVLVQSNGVLQLKLERNGVSLAVQNLTAVTYHSGDTVDVAVSVSTADGVSTLGAKAWVTAAGSATPAAEPSAWQITATDNTAALQANGSTGLSVYLSGTATSSAAVSFRGYSVVAIG